MEHNILTLIKNLDKKKIKGYFIQAREDLFPLLKELIPENSSIGCGDSVTLEELGVFDFLRKENVTFYDKYQSGLTKEDKREIYLKNFSADTFISGTNAITLDGAIFNIDGNGSRVAPMLYGPNQVILIVGINKVTPDIDSAIRRTRQIAAPLDAKRLGKQTPCTKLSRCIDCEHKKRICNDFVLIQGQFIKDRIKVIILNEELGY